MIYNVSCTVFYRRPVSCIWGVLAMITIRELANEQGVTYETIRASAARYKKELEGHTQKKNRTIYIDNWGADFLRSKRKENSVVLVDDSLKEELEALRSEVSRLKASLLDSKEMVIQLQGKLIESQNSALEAVSEASKLLAYKDINEGLKIDLKASQDALTEARGKLDKANSDLTTSQNELENAQNDLASAQSDLYASRSEADDLRQRLDAAEKDAETARAEAESYKPSLFGFYRKR